MIVPLIHLKPTGGAGSPFSMDRDDLFIVLWLIWTIILWIGIAYALHQWGVFGWLTHG